MEKNVSQINLYENLWFLLSVSFNLFSSIFKGDMFAPTLPQRQVYEALPYRQ